MRISGTKLIKNKSLNNTQLKYVQDRLNTLIRDIETAIYQIEVKEISVTEDRKVEMKIFKDNKMAINVVIKNGSHEKKEDILRINKVIQATYDIGLYEDFSSLKNDIKRLVATHLILK